MIIKNIILDIDGTIILSAQNIIFCFNNVLRNNKYRKIMKFSNFKKFASKGSKNMTSEFLKNESRGKINKVNSEFLNYYKKNMFYRSRLRKYVIKFLKYCKRKKINLFISTNKSQENALLLLNKLNISSYFNFVAGSDTFAYRKPHKRHLESLYSKFNIINKNTIFIGDSEIDSSSAHNSKTRFVLIKNGYTNLHHKKINCDLKVNNFNQIINFVSNINR
jgi:phosphoglycolate phosphatase